MWPEVKQAKEEKRYELILTGEEVNRRVEEEAELDPHTYTLTHLNFLRISGTPLVSVSEDIGNLINMTNLILQGNKLQALPEAIGSLTKLKLLDVSMNSLTSLPTSIGKLSSLTSLNACANALKSMPNLEACTNLAILDLRKNFLTDFPEICHEGLVHLSEVQLSENKISDVPGSLSVLPALKLLNIASNAVQVVPGDLVDCIKLKEVNFKGNPLSDRRLKKLVESDRTVSRQVLDYVRQHCPKSSSGDSKAAGGKGKKGKGAKAKNRDKDELDELCDQIHVLNVSDTTPVVTVDVLVKDVRRYIVCCVLFGVNLEGENMKKFISAQTKLHDGVCEKRMASTIATHDLSKIKGPLHYTAKDPNNMLIHALGRGKTVTAMQLYQGLQQEAEAQRKHQKRNNVSGIHKFLHLVEKWSQWPCLVDADGTVVSLPPITNSDNTKITSSTTNIFMEVTSGESLSKAKETMDCLVLSALSCGLSVEDKGTENQDSVKPKSLLKVGQVRVEDSEGSLSVVYPSRIDLANCEGRIKVLMPGK